MTHSTKERDLAVLSALRRFLDEGDYLRLRDPEVWEHGFSVVGRSGRRCLLLRPCPLCEGQGWADEVPEYIQRKHPGQDLTKWWAARAPFYKPARLSWPDLDLTCPSPICDAVGGLPALNWAAEAGAPYLAPRPVVPEAVSLGTLDDARLPEEDGHRSPLHQAVRDALADARLWPSTVVVVSVPMGVGKTRAAVEILAGEAEEARRDRSTGSKVMPALLMPRHDLIDEALVIYEPLAGEPATVLRGRGRTQIDEDWFIHAGHLRLTEMAQAGPVSHSKKANAAEAPRLIMAAHNIGPRLPQAHLDVLRNQVPPLVHWSPPPPLNREVLFDEQPELHPLVEAPVSGLQRCLRRFPFDAVEEWARARRPVLRALDEHVFRPLRTQRDERDAAAKEAKKPLEYPWSISVDEICQMLAAASVDLDELRLTCPALFPCGAIDESIYLLVDTEEAGLRPVWHDGAFWGPTIASIIEASERIPERAAVAPRYPDRIRERNLVPGRDLPLIETDTILKGLFPPDFAGQTDNVWLEVGPEGHSVFKIARTLGPLLPRARPTVILDGTALLLPEVYRAALAPLDVSVRSFAVGPRDPDAIRRLHLKVGRGALSRRQMFFPGMKSPAAVKTQRVVPPLVRIIRRASEACRTDIVSSACRPAKVVWIVAKDLVAPLQRCVEVASAHVPLPDELVAWARVVSALRRSFQQGHVGEWSLAHQGAVRGSNEWEDHDAVIVMPYSPNLGVMWRLAAMHAVHPDQVSWGFAQAELLQELARVRPLSASIDAPRLLISVSQEAPYGWKEAGFTPRSMGRGPLRKDAALEAEELFRALVDAFGCAMAGLPAWGSRNPDAFGALCAAHDVPEEERDALLRACDALGASGRNIRTLRNDVKRVAIRDGWKAVRGPFLGGVDLKGRAPTWHEAVEGAAKRIW